MSNEKTDTLFNTPFEALSSFRFDQNVVDVFPDMIKRSVPGYSTILHMIGQLAAKYVQHHSKCYDLGCSLGAATLSMRQAITDAKSLPQAAEKHGISIVGIDNSADMLKRCQQVVESNSADIPVTLIESDLQEAQLDNASVVVLNFTLQFIPPAERKQLLTKIYQAMLPGGILILSEKLNFDDAHHDQLMVELHHYFKRANGYSELEIAQKRDAIENVLIPETLDDHKQRLAEIGYTGIDLWFQCFNFSSLIAFK